MRKALLFLLAGISISAQNTSELLNTNWYISQMSEGSQTIPTPAMDMALQPSVFTSSSGNYIFNSKYVNTSGFSLSFSATADSFSVVNQGGCTLLDYWGSNMTAVQAYDQKNCSFYLQPAGHVFYYQVLPSGSGKSLMITDSTNGNKIYYNSFFLESRDVSIEEDAFLILQNPVKENLELRNVGKDLSYQIVNALGQIVVEGKTSGKDTQIDMGHITKGQYFLIVQGKRPRKFIKE